MNLRFEEYMGESSFYSSPTSNLLFLGLGAFGFLISLTGFLGTSRFHPFLPTSNASETMDSSCRTVLPCTNFNLSSLYCVRRTTDSLSRCIVEIACRFIIFILNSSILKPRFYQLTSFKIDIKQLFQSVYWTRIAPFAGYPISLFEVPFLF